MKTLQLGSKGSDVLTLQKFLKAKKFYFDGLDGDFGPNTKKAVWNYQKAKGILIDGVVGKQTWAALEQDGIFATNNKVEAPKETPSTEVKLFIDALILNAAKFIGYIEIKSNAQWDDPKKAGWQKEESEEMAKYMKNVSGWTSGAPYCAASQSAWVQMAMRDRKINSKKFVGYWTAHVMTNVRKLKKDGYLSSEPKIGSLWLARHGATDNGHGGVVIDIKGNTITTIEGNTSAGSTADANLQRQGDGFWKRTFTKTGRGTLKTQGFLHAETILNKLV